LPSWPFGKPQTSFACIRKVHVGIVNSVVHHPNTQSVSFLLSAVLGMLMLARYAHGIQQHKHIYYWHFFFKIEEFLDPIQEPGRGVPLHNLSHIFQDCMMYKYEHLHQIKLKLGMHTRCKVLQQINQLINLLINFSSWVPCQLFKKVQLVKISLKNLNWCF